MFSSILKAELGKRRLKSEGPPLFLTPYNLAYLAELHVSPHPSDFRLIEEAHLSLFSGVASYPLSLWISALMLAGRLGFNSANQLLSIYYVQKRERESANG